MALGRRRARDASPRGREILSRSMKSSAMASMVWTMLHRLLVRMASSFVRVSSRIRTWMFLVAVITGTSIATLSPFVYNKILKIYSLGMEGGVSIYDDDICGR